MKLLFFMVRTALAFLLSTAIESFAGDYPVELIRVIDGDTLYGRISLGFHVQIESRIRFAKLDAFELSQPKGPEARDFLAAFIAGKKLVLTTNKTDIDNYGRPLGIVSADGTDLSAYMRAHGYQKP